MKGIELPINALIIVALALLVLLGIVALWMSGWGGGSQGITIEAAKAAGCGALMRSAGGCTTVDPSIILFDGSTAGVPLFDVPGGADNLQRLCEYYYGVAAADLVACRKVCGCGG